MKRCIGTSLLCLAFSLLLPLLLPLRGGAAALPAAAESPAVTAAPAEEAAAAEPSAAEGQAAADAATTFRVLTAGGDVRETTMAAYLPGVLAGEMPAVFEQEALKAQAVAARTYILYQKAHGCAAHPEAAVCSDPGCCQAWLSEDELRRNWGENYDVYAARIEQAVAETDGTYLVWEGEPILACFHSSSAGATEASGAVWTDALPYLVSVDSPETAADVPDYVTTLELSAADFRQTIWGRWPDAALSGDPVGWVGAVAPDGSGRVESVTLGGVTVSGEAVRGAFGLRSTAFTLQWTGGSFLFTVTGYGHGVGMSQYGANVMAARGSGWRDILAHYYPGAALAQAAP